MRPRKLPTILVLVVMSACFCLGQTRSESATGIEGVIAISPTPPRMTREDVASPAPLINAPFVVTNESGVVASFTTDDGGRFRILVAAGHYSVSQQDNKGKIRRCGPWDVDVIAGQMTKVVWYCGTGGVQPNASAWKTSGSSVSISATPSTGYSFDSWTGSGTGSFTGTTNPVSIIMNGPITETATFTHN